MFISIETPSRVLARGYPARAANGRDCLPPPSSVAIALI